jgi:hypothetical protein
MVSTLDDDGFWVVDEESSLETDGPGTAWSAEAFAEPTTSDNTTVSYSGVNTPGGLPTQPFQSGLTSSQFLHLGT